MMSQAHVSIPGDAAAQLAQLLIDIAAAPGIDRADQYEVMYCRDQVCGTSATPG